MSKEYYADKTRLSASMCKALLRSPAYAFWQMHHPDPPTPQMEFGKAFHLYMEMEVMDNEMFLIDEDSKTKATKAFKKLREEAEDTGQIALLRAEFTQIENMCKAIENHKIGKYLYDNFTHCEHKVEWDLTLIDGEIVKCKSLIDSILFKENKAVIVDWKTCSNAHPGALPTQMYTYGYHIQAAFYIDAIRSTKNTPVDFYFVFVEKEAPFGVSVVKCSSDENDWFLKIGRQQYLKAAQLWYDCHKNKKWPGYGYGPIKATLPGWAINKHRIVK